MRSFVLALLACLLITACTEQNSRRILPPTKIDPTTLLDFNLSTLDGSYLPIARYRGKTVLLHFWATWCRPCIYELPALQHFNDKMSSEDLLVIGIATEDDRGEALKISNEKGVRFPMAIDDDGSLREAFGITELPATVMINSRGLLSPLPDPQTGQISAAVVGPREWASLTTAHTFKQFIRAN